LTWGRFDLGRFNWGRFDFLDRKPTYWVLCYPNVERDKMASENESILFNQNGFMMDDEVNYSNCLLLSYPLN
jgi:hypothetical protein